MAKARSSTAAAAKVGDPVPDFTLPSTAGEPFRLGAHRGAPVVLYFYPKDATSGCTLEAQDFRDLHAKLRRAGAAVWGISRDSLASHARFRAAQELPFHLLSDAEEQACRLFDVIREKNMYGKKVMGIERSTFLIDADGKLRREWRKVSVKGHAAEVLEAVNEL
jgi:peroxiredoxin Q/BCP